MKRVSISNEKKRHNTKGLQRYRKPLNGCGARTQYLLLSEGRVATAFDLDYIPPSHSLAHQVHSRTIVSHIAHLGHPYPSTGVPVTVINHIHAQIQRKTVQIFVSTSIKVCQYKPISIIGGIIA